MASSVNNISPRTSFSRFQDSVSSLDQRPRMLKEFLRSDDSHCHSCPSSSSSSTGFQLYLGKKPWKSTQPIISSNSNINPPMVLLRSRSKSAATFTISAIHKVINLVKVFPFASVKSPLVLSRGISRKSSRRSIGRNEILQDISDVKVKVKDILRWTSFGDLAEEKSTPSDFASVQIVESISSSSLWGKSQTDFTKEDLPLWGSESNDRCLLGQHATNDRLRNIPKVDWSFEECDEQQSPVSVLDDSPFLEDEESISPYYLEFSDQRECTMTPRIQEFEAHSFGGGEEEGAVNTMNTAAEEKAKELLVKVKETSHIYGNSESHDDDNLMLDFFKHELSINGKFDDFKFDGEILRVAKCWVDGDYEESFEWEVEDRREAYVKDMERGVVWNKFVVEQDETSKELEVEVLRELIDEILYDFLVRL